MTPATTPSPAPREPEGPRCNECGSWDATCASDVPVSGCGCARCLRAKAAALESQLAATRAGEGSAEAVHAALTAEFTLMTKRAMGEPVPHSLDIIRAALASRPGGDEARGPTIGGIET